MSTSKPLSRLLTFLFATSLVFGAQGVVFATSLTQPVFQYPLVVPGDVESRSVFVKNAGTELGTLTARIVNVTFGQDTSNAFYDEFKFQGRPVRDFFGQELVVAQQTLGHGEVYELPLNYVFPADSTVGAASFGEVQVSFDVELTLRGGSTDGAALPDLDGNKDHPDATSPPGAGSLPGTGLQLAGLLFGVAALVSGGWLLVRLTRSE